MPNRSYECPDCGHIETIFLAPEEWDREPPDCPVCSSADYHQRFVAPGVLSVKSRAAHYVEKIAEAQEAHQRDTGIRAAEEAMAAENWTKEATRIVEQAREQGQLQPVMTESGIGRTAPVPIGSPMVQSAAAWGRADKQRTGEGSPAEKLLGDIKSGAAPDMLARFRRNTDKVW